MLTRTQQLDNRALTALQSLLDVCRQQDGYTIPVYPHLLKEHRSSPSSFLYYDEGTLVGFLAIFHFHPDACEVALLVAPTHRKQGLAKTLWHTMLPSLHTLRPVIKHLIISTPSGLNRSLLKQHAFHFEHSEYDMEYANLTPCVMPDTPLTIRPATHADIPSLCIIDKACFNPNRPNPELRIKKSLDHPQVHVFIASHMHQIIGQVHLIFEKTEARLTDLSILPAQQRQGFGQALIAHSLADAYKNKQDRVTLIVAAQNQQALQLYQNLGFTIYNAVDYYKHHLTDFELNL